MYDKYQSYMVHLVSNDNFQHHGILGQRWGIRNGTSYPLNPNQYSSAEKKAAKTNSTKESAKVVLKKIKDERAVKAEQREKDKAAKAEQREKDKAVKAEQREKNRAEKESERAAKLEKKEKEALAKEKERAQKEAEKLKITKTKILNSNDPAQIIKYQEYFTNDEIKNALARTKNLDQLRDIEAKREQMSKEGEGWLKKSIKSGAKNIGGTLVKNISGMAINAAIDKIIADDTSGHAEEILKGLRRE